MIDPSTLLEYFISKGCSFFTGVPDSQLQPFCVKIYEKFGVNTSQHIVAANEGNAVALGAGYYLSTKKFPFIYMQNSGLGNAMNPILSLTDMAVYGIPVIYMIGWRGEPNVHDEPQHIKQGAVTIEIIKNMGIQVFILDKDSTQNGVEEIFNRSIDEYLNKNKSIAFLVKKGTFIDSKFGYDKFNTYLNRENVIQRLSMKMGNDDYVVSTTGKISRELYEFKSKSANSNFDHAFLTVGSMGHASSLALAISLNLPKKYIWCIDGDGAVLMHMGNLAIIGKMSPKNFIHIVLNNQSHESVGGMPTVSGSCSFCKIAEACKYQYIKKIITLNEFENFINMDVKKLPMPIFIEIAVSSESRSNLLRPCNTPQENKIMFMKSLGIKDEN